MKKQLGRWMMMGVLAGTVSAYAPVADACGGCFAPPETVQVVTDHRMVLSLSSAQTTLWDQFRYSGRPSEFSWILPIRYTERLRIATATNQFMQLVDAATAPQVFAPTRPVASCGSRLAFGASADSNSAPENGGVQVLREQTVGPYEVRVIRGDDPMAMRTWLRDNGFSVPAALEPIVDHYTAMRADYLAVRLRAGEGVDRMVPMRITMEGYQPALPLRMIAAGVADKVGLSLLVIANGRMEASNFPNGEVRPQDLVWDWNNPGSPARDFLNAFDRLNREAGGRLWLTESSMRFSSASLAAQRWQIPEPATPPAMGDATLDDDLRVAFEGLGSQATITRMRADLQGRMLDRDLQLSASTLGVRSRNYNYGDVRNTPVPTCNTAPNFADGGIRCAAQPGVGSAGAGAWLSLGVLGLCAARLRRRATAAR
ncbi:MAG: DUF2330 domain-containing protein [Polyangiales bacterium]